MLTGLVLGTLPVGRPALASDPRTALLEGGVPLLLVGGVLYAGWTYAPRESPAVVAVVTTWTLAVVAGMVVVALWIATVARLAAAPVSFVTLSPVVTSVGGVVGLWLGTSNARWRARDAALRRERDRMEFPNELLRHYVLNAMQVVIGRADALTAGGGPSVDVPDSAPVVADDALETLVESLLYHGLDRAADGDAVALDADAIDADDEVFRFQLYLAATLVERYGGDISIREVDGGARTTVTLRTPDDDATGTV